MVFDMKTRHRAFLELEAIVALGIIIVLVGALTAGIVGFARASHALVSQQQATLAAESVLNELRGGAAPAIADLEARFRDMKFDIEREPAEGDFTGLDLATVRIDAFTHGKRMASVRLSGYIPKEVKR